MKSALARGDHERQLLSLNGYSRQFERNMPTRMVAIIHTKAGSWCWGFGKVRPWPSKALSAVIIEWAPQVVSGRGVSGEA